MTARSGVLELFQSSDLIALAFQADRVRKRLCQHNIVSYSMEADAPFAIAFERGEPIEQVFSRLDEIAASQPLAVFPRCQAGATAAEYLKLLALTRICLADVPHVQTSTSFGLKICQIALRFGADDIVLGDEERHRPAEEQIRRLIRDAGFIPKRRDASFGGYALD